MEGEASLECQLKKEGYLCARQGGNTARHRREAAASDTGAACDSGDLDLDAAIDSDTRLKLEALLASAGSLMCSRKTISRITYFSIRSAPGNRKRETIEIKVWEGI